MPAELRPHLAYVFERFPTFTQTFCVREVLELIRQGFRPLIFSLRDPRDEPVQSYPAELRERVHYLPDADELTSIVRELRTERAVPRPVDHTLRYWKDQPDKLRVYEAAWIGHQLRQLAPDVRHVHCHFAGRAARVLWWLRNFHGVSFSFTAHANDVFCAETATPVGLPMLMRDASRIVTVSDYTVRRLAQEHPGCGRKLRRVYNGLDLQPWRDASKGTPAGIGNRKIYSIGRLIEKKGFDDLIRASAILRDHGVSHSVHIVGGGPEEEALRKLIEQLGLSSHVFLEGEWDQNRIIQALASDSHLFALACVTEKDGGMDNLPTVLMEAMAIGLPCVSTRLAGVPEMVIDGQTGLLCEERKPEDLANLLERLLGDEALCRTYGKNGFQLAAERFDQAVTSRILQRALVSGGDICFDPELIQRHPQLLADYVKEAPARVVRAIRQRPQFSAEHFMADSAH